MAAPVPFSRPTPTPRPKVTRRRRAPADVLQELAMLDRRKFDALMVLATDALEQAKLKPVSA